MNIIFLFIKIIFLLGFLIFIHESGHFTVAKFCKVKVNQFAIGFGPTIWSYQGKETLYAIRLIPLGGFVSMEGEEEKSDKENSFNKAKNSSRIAIVAAGAIVNIIFGIILYFLLILSIKKNLSASFNYTGEYIVNLLKSIGMLFTGKVGINEFTGPIGISNLVAKTTRNKRIFIFNFNDFCITWNIKSITSTSFRWRKNFIINN